MSRTDTVSLTQPKAPGRSATTARRPAATLVAAALAIALVSAAVAVLLSGAAAPMALLDPGALVRWGLPVVTVLVHLAAMTTIGGLALCAVVLPPAGPMWRRATTISAIAAIAWALLQALHLVFVHASVMGSLGGPGYAGLLVQFVSGVELGTILAWAVILTGVTATLAVLGTTPAGARWAAIAAALALIPRAGLGHAASAGDHELAVSAMWLHLLGIGLWAGALAVLFLATIATKDGLAPVVTRYSAIAGWAVLMVVVSGVANAWIRLDSPLQLVTTAWGLLLTVKILAFIVLGAAGWWHRRSTIPLMDRTDGGQSWPFWRLVSVEILIMAAVVGVSVALGSTEPPIPQAELSENAELVALPDPWFAGLFTQWSLDPLFLLLAGAGTWVYVSWVRRLRSRGDAWPAGRTVCWLIGMVLLVWVTNGGPAVYGRALFSVHMLQHMMLISVLPVFLVLAAPASLSLRALPRRGDGTAGPRELMLSLLQTKWAQFFAHPAVAALNVVLSMAVFYFSPLFELALRSHWMHLAMMVHFTLVGYLFTNVMIGTDPGPRRPFYPVRLTLLLPSVVFHTFFGLFLLSSNSLAGLLAGDYFIVLRLPWVDPVTDQQLGGAVSWAMGELPVLALAMIVATRWAMHDERAQRRRERCQAREPPEEVRRPASVHRAGTSDGVDTMGT